MEQVPNFNIPFRWYRCKSKRQIRNETDNLAYVSFHLNEDNALINCLKSSISHMDTSNISDFDVKEWFYNFLNPYILVTFIFKLCIYIEINYLKSLSIFWNMQVLPNILLFRDWLCCWSINYVIIKPKCRFWVILNWIKCLIVSKMKLILR